jgi:iron complex transport system permease protein
VGKHNVNWKLLLAIPLIALIASLFFGVYRMGFSEILNVLWAGISRNPGSVDPIHFDVIWRVRMPRAILGLLVGASLGVSGAALQGVFRNPLVDAGILGVSSGAGFGAALAIVLFDSIYLVYIMSFLFSMIAVIISIQIGSSRKRGSMIMLVLGGVIVSSIFSALISFLKYVADPYNELPAIVFWLMGSLANVSYREIYIASIPMIVGMAIVIALRWRLNVMSIGLREAHALGMNTRFYSALFVIGSTLATAGAVSICGIIGWIGLIVPHMGRFLVGNDHRKLVPVSAVLGAFMLLMIDNIGRLISGGEIPLNILTALIGGPFYIYLLKRTQGGGWS